MPGLSQIIQISAAHAWFYRPVAVVLGALHALEPGHAKSLMAAYIVAVRGTSGQAALLGYDHSRNHEHSHHHPQPKAGASAADIVWFGFTGGLLPCPAAIAVLLVCIQLKQFTLGIAMVTAFSLGLAATLVIIGVAASWASRKASITWPWLDRMAQRLPYLSAGVVMILGLVMSAFHAAWLATYRKPN